MQTKLKFGILVLLLALFGRYLEQSAIPNQQIVIEFSNEDVSERDAKNTIDDIQLKLQSIGVEDIQIGQSENGQLKITYYSDADVTHIEEVLSTEQGFKLTYDSDEDGSTNFPFEKALEDYELNISEIQNGNTNTINWDFESVKITELNQESERFYNAKVNSASKQLNSKYSNSLVTIAIEVNTTVVIAIDSVSYKIPDVRAGPYNGEFFI